MTAYHDLDTPAAMRSDAAAAGRCLPVRVARLDVADPHVDLYADLYAGWEQDRPKPQVEVTEAAQRIAAAMGLALD